MAGASAATCGPYGIQGYWERLGNFNDGRICAGLVLAGRAARGSDGGVARRIEVFKMTGTQRRSHEWDAPVRIAATQGCW
jgi:hypothetical protein